MRLSFVTNRGAVRRQNQDALQIGEKIWLGDMAAPESLEGLNFPLLISVVDGMGGQRGGEKAAAILARALADGATQFGAELDPERDERLLRGLLKTAEIRMNAESQAMPSLANMGAVVSGLIVRERSALAFNCGDCRTYRLSGGELEKLTHDHSMVQEMRDRDEISEDDMRVHPMKNIVLSAVSAEIVGFRLYTKCVSRCEDDVFFVCSDGVWEALDTRRLTQYLNDPAPNASQKLFKALLAAGCGDNISFIF